MKDEFHREKVYLYEIHGCHPSQVVIEYHEMVGEDTIYVKGKFVGYADLAFDEEMLIYYRDKKASS